MFAPVGFGVSYLVFPLLFLIFFVMVGATAVVTRMRARRTKPMPPVEQLWAVVRQKQVIAGAQRRYRAVFTLETGGEAVLFLTRVQYQALTAGERGVLVHKGKRLLCFRQSRV